MSKYNWNKERIQEVIKDCDSLSETLLKLGIPNDGGNTCTLRKKLEEYNIDYSHFTYGAKKKKDKTYISAKEFLGTNKNIQTSKLKNKLLNEGLKENKCENPNCPCKGGYWLEHPLVCQLHHINGIRTDNRLENLQMLCPNCHSQTDNYCGNANKTKEKYYCIICGKEKKTKYSKCCAACASRKIKLPLKDELINNYKKFKSFLKLGKFYNVSDNAVRKWFKHYNLPYKKNELCEYINKL